MITLNFCGVFILQIILSRFNIGFAADPNRSDGDPQLKSYLQPNHVDSGEYDTLTTQDAEAKGICTRPCEGAKPLVCYYHFTMENYATMGPACGNCSSATPDDCYNKHCVPTDGVERAVLTINRQIPGPSIQVCLYDTIVVDVHNKMRGKTVTLHWHGLYQRRTPYMDGVQFVTQCPILHSNKFRYKYPGVPDGTFFYHSHIGLQKMDGIEGSFIIREPRSRDKTAALWDYDLPSHVLIITDWIHGMTDEKFPGFTRTNVGNLPETYLINGRNNYVFDNGSTILGAPYSQFNVKQGFRYRFRVIAGSCLNCPYIFTVERHRLLLIATDGTYCQPEEFDTITMVAGDRMDVVINATVGNSGDSFWIQVKAACADNNNTDIHGEAILHYATDSVQNQAVPAGSRPDGNTYARGRSLNAGDVSDCVDPASDLVCMSHVSALEPPINPIVLKATPDFRLPIGIDFHIYTEDTLFYNDLDRYHKFEQPVSGVLASALLNNRSFEFSPFPLLTQINQIPPELQCGEDAECTNNPNSTDVCECTQVLRYDLGSVGELVFVDMTSGGAFYPMHLHGNDMYIIEQGKIPANYSGNVAQFIEDLSARLDEQGAQLNTTRPAPVVKDTIGNIPGGYTVVRVHFNNPGFWLLHCHFIFHTDVGMALVLQIGERFQMREVPNFFPRCNNYLPWVYPFEFARVLREEKKKRDQKLDNQ